MTYAPLRLAHGVKLKCQVPYRSQDSGPAYRGHEDGQGVPATLLHTRWKMSLPPRTNIVEWGLCMVFNWLMVNISDVAEQRIVHVQFSELGRLLFKLVVG
jgi:hypothetical protein